MGFYKSIARVYNQIFPLNPGQVNFTTGVFVYPGDSSILDIGCGTGSLSLALASTFKRVVGIDLDEKMIEEARSAAPETLNLEFIPLNMLAIDPHFHAGSFDGILCYGNTLVHLSSLEQISLFFKKCKRLLAPKGKLLIQIINYDRILDQKIGSLPTIESDELQFVRNYIYHPEEHLIDFETILTLKAQGQVIRNSVPLFPVRKSELEDLLKDAGFSYLNFFGNFKREILSSESIPLVIEAG